MGKKTKSKARLDKYYHLSKEMGYRSRAAFKLIQLNKKYNFLSGATVLIDLCAAPGGWCQVASKEMPVSSIKIGIDLDPIKPIPGVTTFQCDITTEQCRHLIRKEIKHLKADVVLHDGAPNVGGQWAKDSYNQNELVLFSIKLAVEFLKEGGWFISKVFRSVDYNALIYVMRQLFNKVEATKPLASRAQAAEIFVICQGYKNPSYIDPKLLDPKYALKQIDDEDAMKNNAINSIKAIFERKKNRSGYNTDTLFIVKSFKDFIECPNPFKFLFETNKIKIQTDDCQKYIKLIDEKKIPKEYLLYFDDLQVLGKKEMEELVIWRNKIRTKLNLSRKENLKEKEKEMEKEGEEEKEEDKKDEITKEMDEELLRLEKSRKKKLENQKKKQENIELSNKRAFILQEDQPHDNDVEVDDKLFEYIQDNKIDIENLEEPKEKKEEKEEEENLGDFNEVNLSDLSEDDYIDMMNEDIEQNKKLYEEEKELARKKKKEKKEKKKKKGEIELVKNDNEEEDEFHEMDDDNDEEEENEGDDSDLYYEDDEEDEAEEEEKDIPLDEDLKDDVLISNPLRKEKKKKEIKKEDKKEKKKEKKEKGEENEEDNLSYDSDEKEEEKKENELLNKKTKRSKEKDYDSSSSDSENDGYNSDDKAEIRAIAKKMLRKKERIKILNASYNRYAFEDDEKVPKWFLDEESKHNKPQKPITKAEVLAEKEYLKKITVRMPKKVLEAKARKRNRLNKRLQKIKKQAENIANQDEYTEISKVRQIEKLYKREINKSKDKKKYVISRSWSNNRGKDTRNVKHVDRRLKKDKRAIKAREKRNKKYKRRH